MSLLSRARLAGTITAAMASAAMSHHISVDAAVAGCNSYRAVGTIQ